MKTILNEGGILIRGIKTPYQYKSRDELIPSFRYYVFLRLITWRQRVPLDLVENEYTISLRAVSPKLAKIESPEGLTEFDHAFSLLQEDKCVSDLWESSGDDMEQLLRLSYFYLGNLRRSFAMFGGVDRVIDELRGGINAT